jgi:hypothetical protein
MNPTDYIDFIIKSLFDKFTNLSECSYYFDECSGTHFININDPNLISSEAFCVFDADITAGYYDLSFQGAICFISDYSIFPEEQFKMRRNPFIAINIEELFVQNNSFKLDAWIPSQFVFSPSFEFAHDIPVDPEIKYKLAA